MATEEVKQKNSARAKKVENYNKSAEKRGNDQATLKAAYLAGNGEIILGDIRTKIQSWQKLNAKLAQDGVAVRATGHKLVDGSPEVENVFLSNDERARYLDKNAGLQGLWDYIERMTAKPESADPEVEVEKDEESGEEKEEVEQ